MDEVLTIDSNGNPYKVSMESMLINSQETIREDILMALRIQATYPNSEFITILKDALNTIATDEIEKAIE